MAHFNHVRVGPAGSAVKGLAGYTVQFTAPVLSSGTATASLESTYTVTGLSTGTVLVFTPTNPISARYNVRPRCSTANELTLAWGLAANGASSVGSGESTNRGVLLEIKF